MSPLFIMAGAAIAAFALLLLFDRGDRPTGRSEPAFAALVAINVSAVLGLAWIAVSMLVHDGVMAIELLICAALIAVVALIIFGGYALKRRGRVGAAFVLLAATAIPAVAIFAFLFYLDGNPIDMR